jgi:hypothetical protein
MADRLIADPILNGPYDHLGFTIPYSMGGRTRR